jgi:tetratricopeptide (TPR) repeat protein
MIDSSELEVLKSAYREYVGDPKDEPEWRVLTGAAMWRKHAGDLGGAIEAMVKAIAMTRAIPSLSEETAIGLNYLADLYLRVNATEQAEDALRESIKLSRPAFPSLLADDLWILADIQHQKGEHRGALASAQEARRLYEQQGHAYGVAQAETLLERIKKSSSSPSAADTFPTPSPLS